MAARNVQDIGGHAKARYAPAQLRHQRLAFRNGQAEMGGPRRQIGMVEVVGFHPIGHQRAEEVRQRLRPIVHAAQQHGLREHGNAGIRKPGEGAARLRRQLRRMVDMNSHIGGEPLRPQGRHQIRADPFRRRDGHAGVEAHHLNMGEVGEALRQMSHAARGEHEGIAPGQDDFPDLRVVRHIGQRGRHLGLAQGGFRTGSDHFPPETEPAINRAHPHHLQQHPVGIAMHDALDRGEDLVPDGIGPLDGPHVQFGHVRDKLADNGGPVVPVLHQARERRCDRNGITGGDAGQIGAAGFGREAGGDQVLRGTQSGHYGSETG